MKNNKSPGSDSYAAEFGIILTILLYYKNYQLHFIKAPFLAKACNNFMLAKARQFLNK